MKIMTNRRYEAELAKAREEVYRIEREERMNSQMWDAIHELQRRVSVLEDNRIIELREVTYDRP